MTGILITGATGYLGRHILQLGRTRGLAVTGLARGATADIRCDLTDPGATAEAIRNSGAGTVVHGAAEVPKTPGDYQDEAAAERSLAMVSNLLAARPARLVLLSSMTVYPDRLGHAARPCDVASQLRGYPGGKLRAEELVRAAPETDIAILRLPGLFGNRDAGLLHNATRAFCGGKRFAFDGTPPSWAAMHVEDAADMILRTAGLDVLAGRVINIGYRGRFSVQGALSMLSGLAGVDAPRLPDGPEFEFDLDDQDRLLGTPDHTFEDRLRDLVDQVRTAGTA